MNFMGLAFTESNTISQSLTISCVDLCALGLSVFLFCVCAHMCAAMAVCVCVCVQCVKCVKQIDGFFEDVFWSLEGGFRSVLLHI